MQDTPNSRNRGGRPRRTDITPEGIRGLRAQGLSLRQIACQVRAGYGTVRKALCQAIGTPEASENPNAEVL